MCISHLAPGTVPALNGVCPLIGTPLWGSQLALEAYLQSSLLWPACLTHVNIVINITIISYEVLIPTSAGLKKIPDPTYLLGKR